MNNLLIIYPHWPPSNLVGVHRVRLIANELVGLGWKVTVLTVDERDYEEPHDPSSLQLVDSRINVVKVRAKNVQKVFGKRLFGDIGIRAFRNLKKKALELCDIIEIDCAWISTPSWYTSLIGNHLDRKGVPFGIDYQDPWVHEVPDHTSLFSRKRWTIRLARFLEPRAVKHASFITGINQAYFQGCVNRNSTLKEKPQGALQLGFGLRDHSISLPDLKSPWEVDERVFIYAGAYLPMSQALWEHLFLALRALKAQNRLNSKIRFYLFGTGSGHDHSLQQKAEEHGLTNLIVENHERIPFLHVQELLRRAEGVLSIGSIESHYSASKTFQCLLSGRKLFSYFHQQSEAKLILQQCQADKFHCDFVPNSSDEVVTKSLQKTLTSFFDSDNSQWSPNLRPLENFSAKRSAQKLIETIEIALE